MFNKILALPVRSEVLLQVNRDKCNVLNEVRCLFGYKYGENDFYFNSTTKLWEWAVSGTLMATSPMLNQDNIYDLRTAPWTTVVAGWNVWKCIQRAAKGFEDEVINWAALTVLCSLMWVLKKTQKRCVVVCRGIAGIIACAVLVQSPFCDG
eukprot:GHVS01079049.1.p1 GENE.GHVS01079049.1~~GHVS01079049.1.p1  ORF type:complete len:151 (-),score=19.06 GHVS01079049.1:501-953(-)